MEGREVVCGERAIEETDKRCAAEGTCGTGGLEEREGSGRFAGLGGADAEAVRQDQVAAVGVDDFPACCAGVGGGRDEEAIGRSGIEREECGDDSVIVGDPCEGLERVIGIERCG